jgi:hypothetical protein
MPVLHMQDSSKMDELAEALFQTLVDCADDRHLGALASVLKEYKEESWPSYTATKRQGGMGALLLLTLEEVVEYRQAAP